MFSITDTNFNKVIGKLNLVPLFGDSFPKVFPILLILFIIIETFDLYGKFLSLIGLQTKNYDNVPDDKSLEIIEGKKIIMKAKLSEEKKKLKFARVNLENFKFYDTINSERVNQ